jgi:PTH1 family peptidyl-tRNA hydrolase
MKLVVGLGNPGPRYAATRHNVGFRVVERFADDLGIALSSDCFEGRFGRGPLALPEAEPLDVAILEPLTWMNLSGDAVVEAISGLGLENPGADLLVALDDVDLPFGRIRIRPRGGSGGHRGLEHVIERLGHRDFPRLRFGVGRPGASGDTVEHVLDSFSPDEEAALPQRVAHAAEAVRAVLVDGLPAAMNRYNRDPAAAPSEVPEATRGDG